MQKIARKIFYTGLLRFQILIFALVVLPLVTLKILFVFYPSGFGSIINVLIIASISLATISGSFYSLFHYISLDKTLKPVTQMAEVGELAARVAHDLRGPLSSLRAVVPAVSGEKEGNLLVLSLGRLEKIASDLLTRYKGMEEEKTVFDLHVLLDELVGEYASQPLLAGVRFVKKYVFHPVLIEGKKNRIERAFGNIVKNAMEAMELEGIMTLSTREEGEDVVAEIADTGPGLSSDKIGKIMSEGFTEGKQDGHGIGLTYVREVLAEHGGKWNIRSAVGRGCCFQLRLPFAGKEAPAFVLEGLENSPAVVMDDDPSMLEQWRLVLEKLGISAETYVSYEDFESRRGKPGERGSKTAIVDYHFDNSEMNGFQVIEKLRRLGFQHLYLCTAEYWKPSLKAAAGKLGVPVISKPLPKIEMKLAREAVDKGGYKVLVIDDDKTVRLCWEVIQEKLHIETLHLFASLEALMARPVDLRSIDIAFVDKNIEGSRFSGAEVVGFLKSKGVAKVVLASGENREDLERDRSLWAADFILNDKIPSSFQPFFS